MLLTTMMYQIHKNLKVYYDIIVNSSIQIWMYKEKESFLITLENRRMVVALKFEAMKAKEDWNGGYGYFV